MSVYYPEAVPSLARTKVKVTAGVATPTAPSLAGEINAASSEDVSLTIRDWNPTMTPNTGQAQARLGTKTQMPLEGRVQYSGIEIRYPYNPQENDAHADNAAKAFMTQNTRRDVVVRKGVDIDTPFAVGDDVEVWQVNCGKQVRTRSGDAQDDFGEYEIVQMLFPVEAEVYGTVVA